MPLPHLAFKNALLNPFEEFGFAMAIYPFSLLGPAINISLLQTPVFDISVCLASLGVRHMNLCLVAMMLSEILIYWGN